VASSGSDPIEVSVSLGYQYTQILATAARLRVIDAILDGARQPDEIARHVGADPMALGLLLELLVHLGLLTTRSDDGYHVTARGAR